MKLFVLTYMLFSMYVNQQINLIIREFIPKTQKMKHYEQKISYIPYKIM